MDICIEWSMIGRCVVDVSWRKVFGIRRRDLVFERAGCLKKRRRSMPCSGLRDVEVEVEGEVGESEEKRLEEEECAVDMPSCKHLQNIEVKVRKTRKRFPRSSVRVCLVARSWAS
jgi:hypothetical protein